MSSRRWALKRESYKNRSAVSVHVGQSDHRGQLNVSVQYLRNGMHSGSGVLIIYLRHLISQQSRSICEKTARNYSHVYRGGGYEKNRRFRLIPRNFQ